MEQKNRIIVLRKKLGKNQLEFAQCLGVKQATISAIEVGKNVLTEKNIKMICLTFGVNDEWLRTGEGEMFDDEQVLQDDEKKLLELFRQLSPRARKMLDEYAEKLLSDEKGLRPEGDNLAKNVVG